MLVWLFAHQEYIEVLGFLPLRRRCGQVADWLGCWMCDQQVAGSNPSLPAVKCNPGQVVSTHVALSLSSIIWYQPMMLAAGMVTIGVASHWPCIRPRRGTWSPTYGVWWSMVSFTVFLQGGYVFIGILVRLFSSKIMQKILLDQLHNIWWKSDTWVTEETIRFFGGISWIMLWLGYGYG